MRILVVEDDPMNVEFFEAVLEADGHELAIERDGPGGEARALADEFDLILLDVQLPGRSGIDVCRALRNAGVQTPIIALSASVLPEEVAQTRDAGFTGFVSKPVSPDTLRAAVRPSRPDEQRG